MGDPSGIGPEVITRSMASPEIKGLAIFVVVGDAAVMERASAGSVALRLHSGGEGEFSFEEGVVNLIDPAPPLEGAIPGQPSDDGSAPRRNPGIIQVRTYQTNSRLLR